jgi:hypothetical protein
MGFRIQVDISELAEKLKTTRDLIQNRVVEGIKNISLQTHEFILNAANEYFARDEVKRQMYLGLGKFGKGATVKGTPHPMIDRRTKFLVWTEITRGLWVVDLDPKAQWLETGAESRFMDWLLTGKSAKTAKDGSKYAVIPFVQTRGKKTAPGASPGLAEVVKKALEKSNIDLHETVLDDNGNPKIGVIHKLNIKPKFTQQQAPSLYSKPRGFEEAMATGLGQHSGIYKLKGLVITQKLNKEGNPVKETVVFRVISEKHRGFRWMYPKVDGAKLFDDAYDFANQRFEKMVKEIENELSRS